MSFHAVELSGVAKRYAHFALSGVDLTLESGQVLGLIGPNGAGKSTTLRILLGLVRPDAGTVRVLGRPMPADEVAIKRDVGFASEDLRLYPRGTLRWHMEFVRSIYPSWDSAYADQLVHRFDLEPRQKLKGMSHGQRVKAALLLLFSRRPKLLVLDEPTTGLDPVARHEVLGALMEALGDEERTVVFSSHNTVDVEQISDRITFVDRGRIVAADDKESFLDRWRRIRLETPPGRALPLFPGSVRSGGAGRTAIVTTDRFDDALTAAYAQAGATIQAVEPLTLEEIFVASVERRRQGATA